MPNLFVHSNSFFPLFVGPHIANALLMFFQPTFIPRSWVTGEKNKVWICFDLYMHLRWFLVNLSLETGGLSKFVSGCAMSRNGKAWRECLRGSSYHMSILLVRANAIWRSFHWWLWMWCEEISHCAHSWHVWHFVSIIMFKPRSRAFPVIVWAATILLAEYFSHVSTAFIIRWVTHAAAVVFRDVAICYPMGPVGSLELWV